MPQTPERARASERRRYAAKKLAKRKAAEERAYMTRLRLLAIDSHVPLDFLLYLKDLADEADSLAELERQSIDQANSFVLPEY